MENLSGKSFDNIKLQQDLLAAPWISCKCGSHLFDEATMYKRLSSLLSPTGTVEHVPAKVVLCRQCGMIPTWFSELSPGLPANHLYKEQVVTGE
jgi:hypothetical protein